MFVAITHDDSDTGNELSAYLRLESAESLTAQTGLSAAIGATDDLYIGHSPFGERFSGDFAFLKTWDAVLTSDELYMESVTGLPKKWSDLYSFCPAWSSLDTDTGAATGDLFDWSGSGNHAPGSGTLQEIDDSIGTNVPLVPYGMPPNLGLGPVAAVGGGANPKGVLGGVVLGGPFGGPTG